MAIETNPTADQKSYLCGLFSWRPPWLQNLLSFKIFVLLYMIFSGTQTIILSYLTVVLSTIEKEFGLKCTRMLLGTEKSSLTLNLDVHFRKTNLVSLNQVRGRSQITLCH